MSARMDKSRLRRLEDLARDVRDLDLDNPDLIDQLQTLKARARYAMTTEVITPARRAEITTHARAVAAEKRQQIGKESADRYMPFIRDAMKRGADSYSAIARELDRVGVRPPRTDTWNASSVRIIMKRVGEGLYEA